MRHVLKCGLMALMLGGFAGQAMAAANTEGKIRVAVEFDAMTGCWQSEVSPQIYYNVEVTGPKTFLFIKLGMANPNKDDAAKVSLTEWEGAEVKLGKYNQTGFEVLNAVLPKADVYSLNFGAAMPVTVCQSLENSFRDPATSKPKPEVLPIYREVAPAEVVPEVVDLEFTPTGCTKLYTGRASIFTLKVKQANQYLFVAASAAMMAQHDGNRNLWPNRPAVLVVDDLKVKPKVIKFSPYDELYTMVKLGRPASYKLVLTGDRFHGRMGEVQVCLSRERMPPTL